MSTENQLSNINFFICSTYEDLISYREAVIKKIKSKSGIINAQEFFGSRDQQPLETCLSEVQKSNVFIMFLGMRHGSMDKKSGKSFVECEYDKAKELNLPKFAYFLDDEHPIPSKFVSKGKEADNLQAFKERIAKEMTIDKFTTPDNLAEKVLRDLIRDLPTKGFTIGTEPKTTQQKELKDLISNFMVLPKRYYGQQFDVTVKLKESQRANEEECGAFSMRYGASAKRKYVIPGKSLDNIFDKLDFIFAQDEMAETLIMAPSDTNLKVTLKTIQGEYRWEEPIYSTYQSPAWLNTGSVFYPPLQQIITGYKSKEKLICGLALVKIA